MDKASREKTALIVFLFLIVLSLCAVLGYLAIGHSWNVAATNIDDAAGSLDDYTAILYEGTQKPTPDAEGAPSEGNGTRAQDGPAAPAGQASSGDEDPAAARTGRQDGPSEAADAAESAGLLEVQKDYQSKNAETLILDTEDIGRYYEGMILKKGDRRFGVFSVQEGDRLFTILQKVLYFKRYQVDFIVVLAPDMKYVEGVQGIDIVISTQDENLFAMGETIDGTFYTSAPVQGDVGVIIISPSNVITSKDIAF